MKPNKLISASKFYYLIQTPLNQENGGVGKSNSRGAYLVKILLKKNKIILKTCRGSGIINS